MSTYRRLTLQPLSDAELAQIEETSYRILEDVGIALQHTRAAEMLHGAGCRVDKGRVFMPRQVVERSLKQLTSARVYRNRDATAELVIGDGQVRFHNGGGPPFIFDLETGQRRPATLQDCADMTRTLDALPHVDVITPLFGPQDVPAELMSIAATEVMLRNTTKPVTAAAAENPDEVRFKIELAAACCGGLEAFKRRPTTAISVSPISPLTFSEKVTGAIITAVEMGAPFHSLPAPSLGATGPITMAGALAQQQAEVLASFVIANAARPGAAVSYCSRISPIDMRSAVSSWGGPEVGLSAACAGQLAHRLGFVCDGYGLASSSCKLDPQWGWERFANALVPALAGVDILSGVGGMESGLSGAHEIAVLDNEMISVMKYIIQGCSVDQGTLAFDVIKEVTAGDNVFLGQLHTVQQMRKGALWTPGVADRSTGTGDDPTAGVLARARARAKEILRTHQVEPLPDDVSRHLTEIMQQARRELVGS